MPSSASIDEWRPILAQALESLNSSQPQPMTGASTVGLSERCVEVPWAAGFLGGAERVLDVGWSMAPPEWLGVVLELKRRGAAVEGMDIVDPLRVRSRYLPDMVEEVLATPARVEDVLQAQPTTGTYDLMTCLSTLEHIGFDIATTPDDASSAFVRGKSPDEAPRERDPKTDRTFMDAAARLLRPGGRLVISVPMGLGGPILHQDSLGLFTHQFEYDAATWHAAIDRPEFTLDAAAYFEYDDATGWAHVPDAESVRRRSSAMKPFALACAAAVLRRVVD